MKQSKAFPGVKTLVIPSLLLALSACGGGDREPVADPLCIQALTKQTGITGPAENQQSAVIHSLYPRGVIIRSSLI